MKIYCKRKLSKRSKKEFLHQYFDSKTPTTYYSENNKLQCYSNRNRSIGDLKALLDGSFKTLTSINRTIILLLDLLSQNKIKCLYCGNVNKLVFFGKNKSYWSYITTAGSGDYGPYSYISGVDGYSFNDIMKIYLNKK